MSIINGTGPGVSRLAGLQVALSRQARQRLKWFDYYNSRGHNARFTFRHVSAIFSLFKYWTRGAEKTYNSVAPKRHIIVCILLLLRRSDARTRESAHKR